MTEAKNSAILKCPPPYLLHIQENTAHPSTPWYGHKAEIKLEKFFDRIARNTPCRKKAKDDDMEEALFSWVMHLCNKKIVSYKTN